MSSRCFRVPPFAFHCNSVFIVGVLCQAGVDRVEIREYVSDETLLRIESSLTSLLLYGYESIRRFLGKLFSVLEPDGRVSLTLTLDMEISRLYYRPSIC